MRIERNPKQGEILRNRQVEKLGLYLPGACVSYDSWGQDFLKVILILVYKKKKSGIVALICTEVHTVGKATDRCL